MTSPAAVFYLLRLVVPSSRQLGAPVPDDALPDAAEGFAHGCGQAPAGY